jgi:hypothetical protein
MAITIPGFTRPTVDSVLSTITSAMAQLEQVEQAKAAESAERADAAHKAWQEAAAADDEAKRAARVRARLAELTS